jgi:TfoX/Sxy family transcriptional regulator of competence genes
MPFSESLAGRLRDVLARMPNVQEKKMFGGIGFLLGGNMLVGVWHESLIVRLGPDYAADALQEAHVRPFDVTGKPMKGWVMVGPDGVEHDDQLRCWVERASKSVVTLPAK